MSHKIIVEPNDPIAMIEQEAQVIDCPCCGEFNLSRSVIVAVIETGAYIGSIEPCSACGVIAMFDGVVADMESFHDDVERALRGDK